jgi:hypothetical protein
MMSEKGMEPARKAAINHKSVFISVFSLGKE